MAHFNTLLKFGVEELGVEICLGVSALFSVLLCDFIPHINDGSEVADAQSGGIGDSLGKQMLR